MMSTPPTPRGEASQAMAGGQRCWQPLRLAATVIALAACAVPPVTAGGAHVHGQGRLQVVVDGDGIELLLEAPLADLLGFEHAPRSDAQHLAVGRMAARLRDPKSWFVPDAAARCVLASATLQSAALPPALLGESTSSASAATDADGHADLDARLVWRCAQPAALHGAEVGLQTGFPGLRRLDLEIVTPNGQRALRLVGDRRRVEW
jgi:hypothetical protein